MSPGAGRWLPRLGQQGHRPLAWTGVGPTSSSGPPACRRGRACWWLPPRWGSSPHLPSRPGKRGGRRGVRGPVSASSALSGRSGAQRGAATLNSRSMWSKRWLSSGSWARMSSEPTKMLSRWLHVRWTSNQMEMTASAVDSFCCQLVTSFRKWDRYLDVIRFCSCTWLSSSVSTSTSSDLSSMVPVRGCGSCSNSMVDQVLSRAFSTFREDEIGSAGPLAGGAEQDPASPRTGTGPASVTPAAGGCWAGHARSGTRRGLTWPQGGRGPDGRDDRDEPRGRRVRWKEPPVPEGHASRGPTGVDAQSRRSHGDTEWAGGGVELGGLGGRGRPGGAEGRGQERAKRPNGGRF